MRSTLHLNLHLDSRFARNGCHPNAHCLVLETGCLRGQWSCCWIPAREFEQGKNPPPPHKTKKTETCCGVANDIGLNCMGVCFSSGGPLGLAFSFWKPGGPLKRPHGPGGLAWARRRRPSEASKKSSPLRLDGLATEEATRFLHAVVVKTVLGSHFGVGAPPFSF